MDMLKMAQALRPDLNITRADMLTNWPDGVKQWWLFTPNEARPGKDKCVGNILATSYYKEDELSERVMHKISIELTIFE